MRSLLFMLCLSSGLYAGYHPGAKHKPHYKIRFNPWDICIAENKILIRDGERIVYADVLHCDKKGFFVYYKEARKMKAISFSD